MTPHIERLPSGTWRATIYTGKGRRERRTLPRGVGSKKQALLLARQLEKQLQLSALGLAPPSKASAKGWLDVARDLLAEIDVRNGRDWRYSCKAFMDRFAAFVGDRLPAEVSPRLCRDYLLEALQQGRNASTIRKEISFLKRIFRRCVEERLCPANPFDGLELPSEPPARPRYLTREEFAALLTASPAERRYRYTLAAHTGAELGQLRALTWRDVDFANRLIHLQGRAKGRGGRRGSYAVPMTETAATGLLARSGPLQDHVVPIGRDYAKHLAADCRAAKIRPIRFKDLRHSYGSWLAQAGVPLMRIRDLMGHASAETTQIYAHLAPAADYGATAALDAATPRRIGKVIEVG